MALKFLNKKGWHTGSLRNIENVWKAEQKHEAEQKKLEELRKQIHEERERAEFRQLQEQAGLIPKQERLDFLYESGLAVGKGSSGFKALESLPKNDPETTAPSSSNAVAASAPAAKQQSVPGALFEEKPQSANEAWRKLHSDPLLLIRQKEQEALARIKNNPVQMAMIRKSVEATKKDKDEKKHRTKHHKKNDSDSEDTTIKVKKQSGNHHKGSKFDKPSRRVPRSSDEELSEKDAPRKRDYDEYKEAKPGDHHDQKNYKSDVEQKKRSRYESQHQEYSSERLANSRHDKQSHYNEYKTGRRDGNPDPKLDKSDGEWKRERSHYDSERKREKSHYDSERKEYASERQSESRKDKQSYFSSSQKPPRHGANNRHGNPVKLSEEERAARLQEMQMNAERHEEQRWKRLKKAADTDAQEAVRDLASLGRNFLDAAHKSIYGAERGGSSTIEESVRRRTHYSQGKSDTEINAFRRQ